MEIPRCRECEKKQEKKCPNKVIEINNPSEVVLFRKTIVPASLGDDTTYPPLVGRWHNALVEYEANGHLYLVDSGGIPTRLPNYTE